MMGEERKIFETETIPVTEFRSEAGTWSRSEAGSATRKAIVRGGNVTGKETRMVTRTNTGTRTKERDRHR